jgi:hypothetical protein
MTKFAGRCLIFLKVVALFYIKKFAVPIRDGVQLTSFPLCSLSYVSVNILSGKFYQFDRAKLRNVSWLLTIFTVIFTVFFVSFYANFITSLLVPTASVASMVALKTSINSRSANTSGVPEEKLIASTQPTVTEVRH